MRSRSGASGPPLKRLRKSVLAFAADSGSTLDSPQLKVGLCYEYGDAYLSSYNSTLRMVKNMDSSVNQFIRTLHDEWSDMKAVSQAKWAWSKRARTAVRSDKISYSGQKSVANSDGNFSIWLTSQSKNWLKSEPPAKRPNKDAASKWDKNREEEVWLKIEIAWRWGWA